MDYTFSDKQGRSWLVPEISLHHIMELNKNQGIEINDVISQGHLWSNADQAMLCVGSMLWAFCEGQHEGVTEEQFFTAFDLNVFTKAQEALAARIVNFSPDDRKQTIRKMIDLQILAGDKEVEEVGVHQKLLTEAMILGSMQLVILEHLKKMTKGMEVDEHVAAIESALLKNASSSPEKQESPTQEHLTSEP